MITFEEALRHGTALFAGGPNDDDGQQSPLSVSIARSSPPCVPLFRIR